jgi:hypothetical protein
MAAIEKGVWVPITVQPGLLTVLAGLGRLTGYQPSYARFGEL